MSPDRTIAIIQPFVPNYRVPLFDALRVHLSELGLGLEVWHAEPTGIVAARGNASRGPWSRSIKQHRISVRRNNVTVRNVHRDARKVLAVVHGLASSNVETYALAADPKINLMLWGHGRNFTTSHGADSVLEGWLCRRASHLFLYTDAGAAHLEQAGIGREKMTVVRNSTDTGALARLVVEVGQAEVAEFRRTLGLGSPDVALFVGAFDKPKMMPFLFEAADLIHEENPEFRLILAGAGPLNQYVAEWASQREYAHVVGRADSRQLAVMSHVAKVILMPGRVGLVAADGLALGLPIVTARHDRHAPEVEYLDEGNSVWTDFDPRSYSQGVLDLLSDDDRLASLVRAGRRDALKLGADAAAGRFADGIRRGLGGS